MIRWAALGIFLMLGAEAHALSCFPPNVAQEFNWYQERAETYRVFVGKIKMTGRIPKFREGKPSQAKGVANGRFVNKRNLSEEQSIEVTVKTSCAASWCGGFPTQPQPEDWFMFLQQTSGGNVLTIGPCNQPYGERSLKYRISVLQRCLRKGRCSEADIKRLGTD